MPHISCWCISLKEKKLKISVKDFWPGSGGPEKEEHFSKKRVLSGFDGHIAIME